ncbi:MAG: HAMP domain-containing sensor histidine kinase [Planctomycetota bacterium]
MQEPDGFPPPLSPTPPSPEQAVPDAERLTTLAHELRNLLDGSIRTLGQAERGLEEPDADVGTTRSELDTVRQALEQMGRVLHSAMQSAPGALVAVGDTSGGPFVKLGAAVEHAASLSRPAADDLAIAIEVDLNDNAAGLPVGPLYPLVLNGLRNAVASIRRARASEGTIGGRVIIHGTADSDGRLVLSIEDDGEGPPQGENAEVFRHGYSTTGSAGIGLALSRSVIERLGGTIRLSPRKVGHDEIDGAVLEIRCRMPRGNETWFGTGTTSENDQHRESA